jgi:hypothetical protein
MPPGLDKLELDWVELSLTRPLTDLDDCHSSNAEIIDKLTGIVRKLTELRRAIPKSAQQKQEEEGDAGKKKRTRQQKDERPITHLLLYRRKRSQALDKDETGRR